MTAPTSAQLDARASKHALHAIQAIAATFEPDSAAPHILVATSPIDGALIRLKPVTGQVAIAWDGKPTQHVKMVMDDAMAWAALDILDDLHRLEAAAQTARRAVQAIVTESLAVHHG